MAKPRILTYFFSRLRGHQQTASLHGCPRPVCGAWADFSAVSAFAATTLVGVSGRHASPLPGESEIEGSLQCNCRRYLDPLRDGSAGPGGQDVSPLSEVQRVKVYRVVQLPLR